ncbi:MAG: MBL fold metallo-hydrolase [Proteobacteria bacterium]|nr:MBL fold metallo-hydrolase [Pseudomonadota bacterium]
MKIKFWGVRGSIPCPGPDTVRYGGNTPCIEMRFSDNNHIIIIDSGSGIRELGNHIMESELNKGPIRADILITHTHWDHILGFPFFTPIYLKDTTLRVYGPVTHERETLSEIVGGQLAYRYFPVRHVELQSQIDYTSLKEGPVPLGYDRLNVTAKYLNHPVLCFGYRVEYNGKVFCTTYDTEPFQNVFTTDPEDPSYDETMAVEGEKAANEANKSMEAFVEGADLLVTDAQYTGDDYGSSKKGWGHSSMEDAISFARRAHVKRLALFHFDPGYTDDMLDRCAEKLFNKEISGDMAVFFAREGMEIAL